MPKYHTNRLLVVGLIRHVGEFDQAFTLDEIPGASHSEILECSRKRLSWMFDTPDPPLASLQALSRRWPALTFLLDYESESKRIKGLAKIKNGAIEHYTVRY